MREITKVGSIPVTSVRKTLMDLCGIRHPRAESALDHALFKEFTSLKDLWLLYDEEWTRGRRGIAILRSLLAGRSGGRAPIQSDLEDLFWGLVHARGLPIPKAQFPIDLSDGVIHVDFAYPEDGLLIECDGREWHGDRQAFERDRERDNELQALGYRVIRFTWAKLRYDPDYVEKTLRRYLHRSL